MAPSISAPPPHNNSQHVLAIISVDSSGDRREILERRVLAAFAKTSEPPCDVWRSDSNHITTGNTGCGCEDNPLVLLASNYPNCILENDDWCLLCAGFAYRFRDAFNGGNIDIPDETNGSFTKTLLAFCEGYDEDDDVHRHFEECVGERLKKCSGHFSVYILYKGERHPPKFWAWNDPFGFMPVYHTYNESTRTCVISSYWDCLIPNITSLHLDWNIVAEYITLGTTLGGVSGDERDCIQFDRTFIFGIHNMSPGYVFRLIPLVNELELNLSRYIECYGACEVPLKDNLEGCLLKSGSFSAGKTIIAKRTGKHLAKIRGLEVAKKKRDPPSFNDMSYEDGAMNTMFQFIMDCVDEAQGYATHAALTGGGDTRLILACLLLLQNQKRTATTDRNTKNNDSMSHSKRMIFQTHSKQPTDWLIARHLAYMFRLKHKRIHSASTTTNGSRILRNKKEKILSNLHDQTPLRKRDNLAFPPFHRKSHSVEYTVHGRFGTEFFGCLCFYKSPLDVRSTEELEKFRPHGTSLFKAVFGASVSDICNPMNTLQHRLSQLERDKLSYCSIAKSSNPSDSRSVMYDVAYAFQLQLYTRSTLSDIYGGLRAGSWFAIPTAQFTRNAITPFTDNRLLQCMLCHISDKSKEEPYQLYGKLYQSGVVPDIMLDVPSNNKLLCSHSVVPYAVKKPEKKALPNIPAFVTKGIDNNNFESSLRSLEKKFHPVFWKGAIAIMTTAPAKMDTESIVGDRRPEVKALLDHVGGDVEVVCTLSRRLQNFLLWYERRFLTHCKCFG